MYGIFTYIWVIFRAHVGKYAIRGAYGIWYTVYIYIYGWWFGTMEFYDFLYIGNVIIPTDELIFFRGIETTNQI